MTEAADTPELPTKLPTAGENAAAEALTQADEYEALFGTTDLPLDNGEILKVPPHPDYGMLDDDQLESYEEYLFEIDTQYDRNPDITIPDHYEKDKDGNVTGPLVPGETIRGSLKTPYRKNGQLVKPPHSVRLVQIALGDIDYKRLREGGKSAKDVWKIWGKQSLLIQERQQRDSKSARSSVDLASVSAADS
jgi:hypothetical protein